MIPKRIRGRFLLAAAAAIAAPVVVNSAQAGTLLYDPIVTVVGDGTNTASGVGVTTAVSLYQNSVASQTAAVSSATYSGLLNSYTANSEGALANNPALANAAAQGLAYTDTGYAFSAGYNGADNTANIISTATNANRALGSVTVGPLSLSNATVLQTQTQASAYDNNNLRGAVGNDTGTTLYSAGTGSTAAKGGWRNFSTNTQLTSTPTNVRTVELLGGKLYGSTGSGSTVGIYTIDPTGATAATSFVSTGTSSNHSPYEFALFNDASNTNTINGYNVAYIADDGASTAANGGIEKWTYNGTAWSQAYILKDTSTTYYRGLAGELDATTGNVTLFATTSDGKKLQQVTDTGASSTFTTLAAFQTTDKYYFRGVALAPAAVPLPPAVFGAVPVLAMMAIRRLRRGAGR